MMTAWCPGESQRKALVLFIISPAHKEDQCRKVSTLLGYFTEPFESEVLFLEMPSEKESQFEMPCFPEFT